MSSLAYLLIAALTWICGYLLQKNNDFESEKKIQLPDWLNPLLGLPRSKKYLDIWGTTIQVMSYCLIIGTVIVAFFVTNAEKSQIVLFQFFISLLVIGTILGNLAVHYLK